MRQVAIVAAILALVACAPDKADKPTSAPTAAAAASVAAPAATSAAPSPVATAKSLSEHTKTYEFDYAYPAAAAAIPELVVELEADLAKQRRTLAASARDAGIGAEAGDDNPVPYARSIKWDVVTELPGWLSLSGAAYEYTGGAHPNRWWQALLWDKAAKRGRKVSDLFVSKAALAEAIRAPFCRALNRQRAARRGEPVPTGSTEMFDECIDPTDSTVILGSSNRQQFDRIGVLIAPYEAGSYAEGDYEITLPVTPAVIAALKPQNRSVFALGR